MNMNKTTTSEGEELEKSPKNYKKIISWSGIGVLIVWAATFLLYYFIDDEAKQGQFGDMFGAANALFSGLAFAGLIITLIQQREELSLQRNELKQTRKEFEDQNKTMKRQRFENTFFNLMSLHQNITDNLEYKKNGFTFKGDYTTITVKGREIFKEIYSKKFDYAFGIKYRGGNAKALLHDGTFDVINHYLHFFEGILKFIDESDLLEENERQQYTIMLRNTLSDDERYTIFYYFVAHGGWHKDKAEKYGLFYGIEKSNSGVKENYDTFEPSAYEYNGRMGD